MNALKMKLVEELMSHLSSSQGNDLKSLLDKSKAPMEEEMPEEMMDKPKGISVEKVSVMGKPKGFDEKADEAIESMDGEPKEDLMPGETEMSDDELEELLKQLTSKG